jgi:hypothetical protein
MLDSPTDLLRSAGLDTADELRLESGRDLPDG